VGPRPPAQLADGRRISDPDPDWDEIDIVDERALKVGDELQPGDRFVYFFDLGDDWTHACEVETDDVDPIRVCALAPRRPVAI